MTNTSAIPFEHELKACMRKFIAYMATACEQDPDETLNSFIETEQSVDDFSAANEAIFTNYFGENEPLELKGDSCWVLGDVISSKTGNGLFITLRLRGAEDPFMEWLVTAEHVFARIAVGILISEDPSFRVEYKKTTVKAVRSQLLGYPRLIDLCHNFGAAVRLQSSYDTGDYNIRDKALAVLSGKDIPDSFLHTVDNGLNFYDKLLGLYGDDSTLMKFMVDYTARKNSRKVTTIDHIQEIIHLVKTHYAFPVSLNFSHNTKDELAALEIGVELIKAGNGHAGLAGKIIFDESVATAQLAITSANYKQSHVLINVKPKCIARMELNIDAITKVVACVADKDSRTELVNGLFHLVSAFSVSFGDIDSATINQCDQLMEALVKM